MIALTTVGPRPGKFLPRRPPTLPFHLTSAAFRRPTHAQRQNRVCGTCAVLPLFAYSERTFHGQDSCGNRFLIGRKGIEYCSFEYFHPVVIGLCKRDMRGCGFALQDFRDYGFGRNTVVAGGLAASTQLSLDMRVLAPLETSQRGFTRFWLWAAAHARLWVCLNSLHVFAFFSKLAWLDMRGSAF